MQPGWRKAGAALGLLPGQTGEAAAMAREGKGCATEHGKKQRESQEKGGVELCTSVLPIAASAHPFTKGQKVKNDNNIF